MAIFGNFKGTTQSDFRVGKTGARIHGNVSIPVGADSGDIWIDKSNSTLQVYHANAWTSIGSTLTNLNVDSGTLFVDTANDTVSIGSTSSNEKLFVNGSLRLGTNPSIKYSGAFLDVKHANGSGTVLRLRDNTGNTNPVFKVYDANNTSEVFKVDGANTTTKNLTVDGNISLGKGISVNNSYGNKFDALLADGSGNVSWKQQFYYSTDMYDFTAYGMGYMSIAPNQDPTTFGFLANVVVPYGAVWMMVSNDGLVDPAPITVNSPNSVATPMMWITRDGSGPYDPVDNPNGGDYWFNITPPIG
jgi:hypothetical protein